MRKQLNLIFGDYQHGFLTSQAEENLSAAFLCHKQWARAQNWSQLSWCMGWDPSQLTLDVSKLGINHWLCCQGALHPQQRSREHFDSIWLLKDGISDARGSPRLWGLSQPQPWPVLDPSGLCGCARSHRASHTQMFVFRWEWATLSWRDPISGQFIMPGLRTPALVSSKSNSLINLTLMRL